MEIHLTHRYCRRRGAKGRWEAESPFLGSLQSTRGHHSGKVRELYKNFQLFCVWDRLPNNSQDSYFTKFPLAKTESIGNPYCERRVNFYLQTSQGSGDPVRLFTPPEKWRRGLGPLPPLASRSAAGAASPHLISAYVTPHISAYHRSPADGSSQKRTVSEWSSFWSNLKTMFTSPQKIAGVRTSKKLQKKIKKSMLSSLSFRMNKCN